MKQEKVVYGKNTAKTIMRRVVLNVLIALIVLAGSVALILTLVKFKESMSLGTIITATATCAAAVAFFIWCVIDTFFADNQAYNVKKKSRLAFLEESALKDGKNIVTRGPLFWYIMTIVAALPAAGSTTFMLLSGRGEPINTLFLGPVYLLAIITLYFALYTGINKKMVQQAYAEQLIVNPVVEQEVKEEPVVEEVKEEEVAAPEIKVEEEQEPVIEEEEEEEEEEDLRVLAEAQRLRLQEMVRRKAEQEAAAAAMIEKAKQEAEELARRAKEEEDAKAAEEAAKQVIQEEPIVEEVAIEEPAIKEADFGELDFGELKDEETVTEPIIEERIQSAPYPQQAGPIIQIIFVTPNSKGKMSSISPINIPLPSGNNIPQTLQIMLGGSDKNSPYTIVVPEEETKKLLLGTKKPSSKLKKSSKSGKSGIKKVAKKSTVTKKPVKKSAVAKNTIKKTVKTPVKKTPKKEIVEKDVKNVKPVAKKSPIKPVAKKSPIKKVVKKTTAKGVVKNKDIKAERDTVSSTLKSVSQRLDKISQDLSK